jgi:hypothetical protein
MCPNFSLKDVRQEFDELQSMFGEDMAYLLWNRNNGYHLDKAPNGKSSKLFMGLLDLTDRNTALTIKAKTLSNKFKEWFGNSQVVDENGEPLIVYHTTRNKFDSFYKGDLLHYFSDQPLDRYGGIIMPVFLNIQDMGILEDHDIRKNNPEYEMWGKEYQNFMKSKDGFLNTVTSKNTSYDVLKDINSYIAKSSNQIKSIFNSGEYDRNNDNIYDSKTLNTIENRHQTEINGSMSQEILSNFEAYFPDYAFYNDDQRQIVASMVDKGELQITCSI